MIISNSAKIEYIRSAIQSANDSLELWRQCEDPELKLALEYAEDLCKLDLTNVIDYGDD